MDYEMIFLLVGVAVIIGIKIYVAYQKTKPEKSSKKVHKNTWKTQKLVYVIVKQKNRELEKEQIKKFKKSSKLSLKKTQNRVY